MPRQDGDGGSSGSHAQQVVVLAILFAITQSSGHDPLTTPAPRPRPCSHPGIYPVCASHAWTPCRDLATTLVGIPDKALARVGADGKGEGKGDVRAMMEKEFQKRVPFRALTPPRHSSPCAFHATIEYAPRIAPQKALNDTMRRSQS